MLIYTLVNIFILILALYNLIFFSDRYHYLNVHLSYVFFSIILCLQFERHNITSIHGLDYFSSYV